MKSYSIADYIVNMNCFGRTQEHAEKYLVPYCNNPDIVLEDCEPFILKQLEKRPDLNTSNVQYNIYSKLFAAKLLEKGGFVLHASAVAYENKAYLFSAESGVGKSTHTTLWTEVFPEAFVINDDKPALRFTDGKYHVYGTPWSGSSSKNVNAKVPLQAICFIERGEANTIERLTSPVEILQVMLSQTMRRAGLERSNALLNELDALIASIPFYRLTCLPNEAAAVLAHKVMSADQ